MIILKQKFIFPETFLVFSVSVLVSQFQYDLQIKRNMLSIYQFHNLRDTIRIGITQTLRQKFAICSRSFEIDWLDFLSINFFPEPRKKGRPKKNNVRIYTFARRILVT